MTAIERFMGIEEVVVSGVNVTAQQKRLAPTGWGRRAARED